MDNDEYTNELERLVTDFVAMERDRLLGYPDHELHREPRDAMMDAMWLLVDNGTDPDNIILPEDQERLDIDFDTNG